MSEGRYFYRSGSGYMLEIAKKWGLALEFMHFDDHASLGIHLLYPRFYIRLPDFLHRPVPCGEMLVSWGFSWTWDGRAEDIHLHWGARTKIIHMPWAYSHYRTDILMADGSWYRKGRREWGDVQGQFSEQHPYTYTLKNGTVQERTATIDVDEMEWRWRWFMWLPFPRLVKRCIGVKFNDEVGERTGSWKGGCTGCGYQMLAGESPLDTLRRMERERKF